MSSVFHYSPFGMDTRMTMQGPLWPDFDQDSEMSQKLIQAKQQNDDTYWDSLREVIKHDVETLPLERFKVWASVWNVPLVSTNKHSIYIRIALNAMAEGEQYYHALVDPLIGQTQADFHQYFNMFSDIPVSMNRIQMYSHLAISGIGHQELEKMDTIVEIGAGIGDMADIVTKLGFKGKYIIYDFEEVSLIQKWYHKQLGLSNVHYASTPEQLAELLGDSNPDLTVATWSLTEMPFYLRDDLTRILAGTKNWTIAYSKAIFGYDNHGYMVRFSMSLPENMETQFIDVPFMPWDGGTQYFIAKTSDADSSR